VEQQPRRPPLLDTPRHPACSYGSQAGPGPCDPRATSSGEWRLHTEIGGQPSVRPRNRPTKSSACSEAHSLTYELGMLRLRSSVTSNLGSQTGPLHNHATGPYRKSGRRLASSA
jgi:hypothetical protein